MEGLRELDRTVVVHLPAYGDRLCLPIRSKAKLPHAFELSHVLHSVEEGLAHSDWRLAARGPVLGLL